MKIKTPILIAIIVLIILVILAIVFSGYKKPITQKGEETVIAEEIYGFTAEIKEIKDKTLTLEASILLADTTKTPVKMNVRAVVNDTTKIAKLKFPTEIKDETKPVYPEETKISFNDLKVGDKIDIGTADNISGNIKNNTEFILRHIFIIEK